MKIALGCDHGGLVLKGGILSYLKCNDYEAIDLGTFNNDSVDYPDFGLKVANAVSKGTADLGILLCGTGIGISIAANKVNGIRCAVIHDEFTAEACKAHNNANIIALGGRILTPEKAVELVAIWLKTEFEGGRHIGRLKKIHDYENLPKEKK